MQLNFILWSSFINYVSNCIIVVYSTSVIDMVMFYFV
jgi:hypothetical protein